MATLANEQTRSIWPFASVWRLVTDLAKMNAGDDHQQYPIHSMGNQADSVDPSDPPVQHKLLGALWRCCFHVCEKYVSISADELDRFLDDPRLEELITNLYCQLKPDCEQPHRKLQPILRASLKSTSHAVSLLSCNDIRVPGDNREIISAISNDGEAAKRLLTKLELVSHLWDLREAQRTEYTEANILPFHSCEGDDPWSSMDLPRPTDSNDDRLTYYRLYARSYSNEVEAMLTSLKALFFHIIHRIRNPTIINTDEDRNENVNEFQRCWDVCECLKRLTCRAAPTQEGWMIYELKEISNPKGAAYTETKLNTWEPNPWGKIGASRPIGVSSMSVPESQAASSGSPPPVSNKPMAAHPLTDPGKGKHILGFLREGSPPAMDQSTTTPHAPPLQGQITWASVVLGSSNLPSSETPSAATNLNTTTINDSGSNSGQNADVPLGCGCPVLHPQDIDDLHHIRIRILLRAAAAKNGWKSYYGTALTDFVRDTMSMTTFGKTEKRKKLFTDYRNAMVNPQNNINARGDTAAQQATVVQIKRAVEWKTAAGRHQFLKDLFRAIVGMELEEVDDETDRLVLGN